MGTNTFSIIRVGLLMKRNLMSREMNLQKVSSIMVLIVLFFFLPKVFIGKMFDLDAAHRSFLIFVLICGIVCSLQFYMGLWNRSAFISYWLLPAKLSDVCCLLFSFNGDGRIHFFCIVYSRQYITRNGSGLLSNILQFDILSDVKANRTFVYRFV